MLDTRDRVGAKAEEPDQAIKLERGDRVRISSGDLSGEFTVVGVVEDTLMVAPDLVAPPVPIQLGSLARLDVLETQRRTVRGAVIGGVAGAVGGALMWAALCNDKNCDDQGITGICDAFVNPVFDRIGIVPMVYGPVLGGAVGALIGTAFKSEEWVPVVVPLPAQLSIAPSTHGGVALGYEYSF